MPREAPSLALWKRNSQIATSWQLVERCIRLWLNSPYTTAFDGERILVTNTGGSVSLWKAASLTPIGSFPAVGLPFGACSDGLNFWITLNNANKLARF